MEGKTRDNPSKTVTSRHTHIKELGAQALGDAYFKVKRTLGRITCFVLTAIFLPGHVWHAATTRHPTRVCTEQTQSPALGLRGKEALRHRRRDHPDHRPCSRRARARRRRYFDLTPSSLCASLSIERSAISLSGISRSTLAVFFASSTISRRPASGGAPSSLKTRTALS